jgi:hypothetical protein
MNITIKSIPHAKHRYPTVGDWWFEDGGETLQIRVSQELPQKSQDLVVLHELAEVFMCRANGVGQLEVDQFDMAYEKNRKSGDTSEPGDQKDAPYFLQHQIATMIELIASRQMDVNWQKHEDEIEALP